MMTAKSLLKKVDGKDIEVTMYVKNMMRMVV